MSTEQLPGLQLAVTLLAQIGNDDSDAAIAAVHAVMDPGQPGDLPEGLQLAATLLDGDRDAFICGQAHPVHGLAPSDEEIAAWYLTAIAAIRAEHAQRLTLQHHACDQAQRIADLETRRDTLKRLHDAAADERDELRAKYDELLVALHGIGAALGIPEGDRSPYSVTCGVLERVNRLAEIEAQEEWRDVVGFNGLYAVSNNGKIKSLSCGKILSTPPMGIGYEKATFYKDGKRTQTSVHRVVAEAFIGRVDGLEVNHKDGNKKNNFVDNLEIVTRSENERHSRSVLGNLCKPIISINTETLQCQYFPSIMEASRNGFCDTGIYEVLSGKNKTHHGHLFVYVNKLDYSRPVPAQAVPDASRAEAAGHEHAIGHLGALVEAQRLLLVDVEDICGRDGHGGQFEDGESEIIDRVRAHLATMAAPEAAR